MWNIHALWRLWTKNGTHFSMAREWPRQVCRHHFRSLHIKYSVKTLNMAMSVGNSNEKSEFLTISVVNMTCQCFLLTYLIKICRVIMADIVLIITESTTTAVWYTVTTRWKLHQVEMITDHNENQSCQLQNFTDKILNWYVESGHFGWYILWISMVPHNLSR